MFYFAWSVYALGIVAAIIGMLRPERVWYGLALLSLFVTAYLTISDIRAIWGQLGAIAQFLSAIRGMFI